MGRPRHEIAYPPRVLKNNLLHLMAVRQVDVRQLAQAADVTPATMQRIVEGIDVRLTVAQKIATYLEATVDELWEVAA